MKFPRLEGQPSMLHTVAFVLAGIVILLVLVFVAQAFYP
jgi:hypothetical protein